MQKREEKIPLYLQWLHSLYFLNDVKGTIGFFIEKLNVRDKGYFYQFFNEYNEVFVEIPEDEKRLGGIMTKVYKIDQDVLYEILRMKRHFFEVHEIIDDRTSNIPLDGVYSRSEHKALGEKWTKKN